MTDRRTVRTWAEIDLDALAHNYRLLRGMAPDSKFLGLVKANAYGHGAIPIAKKLEALGVDMLAVACLDEAVELREAGIVIPILCLGQTSPELAGELLEYDVTQTVGDLETGKALSVAAVAAGKTLKIHVKVDTGMGRLGFVWTEGWEADSTREIAALCALPGLEAEGVFTHFSDADGSWEYTRAQNRKFGDVIEALRRAGREFKICHCAASAAVLNYPWMSLNMVRPGIALYGYVPDPSVKDPGLKPVMTVKSRIAAVRALPAGAKISYGCTATLERDSKIAVLPMGYGDGYPRVLSNQMDMLIRGIPCPIVGRVCMDMCMVDVTGLENVQPGEAAVVYGPKLTQRAAKLAGTIPYELLCQLTPRIPRIYLEGGTVIS
ncbi:alanine racemase [Colidextribacter sp. OB.20]|uniref:alanine racemase n=1 Tax=Colidextribacter sp. OB.20 TaxID=2304568 RepID=UPI00136B6887|nr:alanine racemase [Colidextribacter sp. OB.20]NBI10074.1 alanine racemase [Colidextribacter sp. OB.20]